MWGAEEPPTLAILFDQREHFALVQDLWGSTLPGLRDVAWNSKPVCYNILDPLVLGDVAPPVVVSGQWSHLVVVALGVGTDWDGFQPADCLSHSR